MDSGNEVNRFLTNPFLSSDEKKRLMDNDVILISPFSVSQKATNIFDNCIIGTMKNHHGNLVAVYHFERLVFAHWWDLSEQKNENYDNTKHDFEDDFGRFVDWEYYVDVDDVDEEDWYLNAYEFVSTQYIMNMMENWSGKPEEKFFLVAEGNPDLVSEMEDRGETEALVRFNDVNYILHG